MYDRTTRRYTMKDASGSYAWIVANIDPAECEGWKAEDFLPWIWREMEAVIDRDTAEIEDAIECRDIVDDITNERDNILEFLQAWARGEGES